MPCHEMSERTIAKEKSPEDMQGKAAGNDGRLAVTAAASFGEICEAFALVYKEYLKCGYIKQHLSMMHYSVLQLFPTSRTFVAVTDGHVVGTGSVVLDSPAGLPSADVFGDVFDRLALAERRVAEGTMLACMATDGAKAGQISHKIITRALEWSASQGVDDWCVVANPKHVRFWQQKMGMEILGESRPCDHVCGHPGVLLRLPLREIVSGEIEPSPRLGLPSLRSTSWLADPRSRLAEQGHELGPGEVTTLISRRPDILKDLSVGQWSLLRQHHPRGLWVAERLLGEQAVLAA